VGDISPYLPVDEAEALKTRLLAASNQGLFTPISYSDTVHIPTSNGGVLFGGLASEPQTGAVYVVTHDNPGILRLLRPGETVGRGGAPVAPAGQGIYQQNCQSCHGPDRLGTANGVALVQAAGDPVNGAAAGASRFDAAAVRAVLIAGKGRMPAFPHLAATDVDAVVTFLTSAPGGRGGRGAGPLASGAPRELIVGSGSVGTRPAAGGARGRGALPPYPDGVPPFERPVINEYNTLAHRITPPYTSIVKYDLNRPAIEWRVGFGDDPALAANGITGTGMPALNHGLVVTESGLVFGAGGDQQIRAWDSETGRRLWASPFAGNFVGSPVMYETRGRQYLLVPAASAPGGRGARPAMPPAGPLGWVAYALPRK
jgi:quinoprotein glucose dehydrogenase